MAPDTPEREPEMQDTLPCPANANRVICLHSRDGG